jgi:uncharacterized protein YjbI with pentapeptide repeats
MANEEHLKILRQGVEVWNNWRREKGLRRWSGGHKGEIGVSPDLSQANLYRTEIRGVNFSNANLYKVNLSMAYLRGADFSMANLKGAELNGAELTRAKFTSADLIEADLNWSDLTDAQLNGADLTGADLGNAKLSNANVNKAILCNVNLRGAELDGADLTDAELLGADLHGTNLTQANLTRTDFSTANCQEANFEKSILVQARLNSADLSNCRIYGISAWELELEEANQKNLIITEEGQPVISVDNLEVAQFVYLLLSRKKLRNVIDTITSKSVLILGRFTPERKAVLDAMADELRHHNLLPIIFDFERASSRDFTETIKTLAGMSLFVIADITNPKSAPLELQATVPDYQIPFAPVLQKGEKPFSMLSDLMKYPWVLSLLEYRSSDDLIKTFKSAIIDEAISLHKELLVQKAEKMKTRRTEDYLKEPE